MRYNRIIGILVLFAVMTGTYIMNYKAKLNNYYTNYTPICAIPDISNGFIPQGITYNNNTGDLILTGYMGNMGASPIYTINNLIGANKIFLHNEDGSKFTGHAGGISVYNEMLFVAGSTDACMYYLPISYSTGSRNGISVPFSGKTELKSNDDYIRVSFTSVDGVLLFAGEFHKSPFFYTNKSHRVDINGTNQNAYLFGFKTDDSFHALPVCVYSIPDRIQGACFDDEYIYLSQSNGLFPSRLITFSKDSVRQQGVKRVLGKDIPLYILSEESAKKITNIPPMSEEIMVVDDKIYILYESAANRYVIGKFLHQDSIHMFPVSYFR